MMATVPRKSAPIRVIRFSTFIRYFSVFFPAAPRIKAPCRCRFSKSSVLENDHV
jgi:hypothetical protein